jgi:predicted DNA-binding ribbon-helix-helix protein
MNAGSSRLRKRSVSIAGHATSVSMEDAFWVRLTAIAKARGVSVSRLIRDVDATREGNLSSALRVFVLENAAPN